MPKVVPLLKFYKLIILSMLAITCLNIFNTVRTGAESVSTATVSGTVSASDGTPLSNIFVYLNFTNPTLYACTDANGHYSIAAPSDTGYRVELSGSLSYGNPNCGTYSAPLGSDAPTDFIIRSQSESTVADLTTGDVVKNFSLSTSKLTIIAKDADGNLVTAPFRQAYTYRTSFYESAVISGGDSGLLYGTTQIPPMYLDLNGGQVSGYVVKGTVFPAGTICVNPLTSSEYCNRSPVTVNGDTTVTVQAPDTTAPVVTNVQQIWNTVKQRTEITLTFSEPVTGLPQGWYGSGTTYTKAFYNTKLAHVTFVDAAGNTGNATVTPIGPQ